MKPSQLRRWIQNYGDAGVFAATAYLGLRYLWRKRRSSLIAFVCASLLIGGLLFRYRSSHYSNDSASEKQRLAAWVSRLRLEASLQLIAAVKDRNLSDVYKALASGADPNARDVGGHSAVSLALDSDNEVCRAILRVLIEAGGDPNAKNDYGVPALVDVAGDWKRDTQTFRLLLERGADPNAETREGKTALMDAAWTDHIEAIRLLIPRVGKAGVNHAAKDGTTALIEAAHNGNNDDPAIVKLLLDAGADPNAEDNYHNTALFKATFVDCHAGWSSPKVMQYLLDHGARLTNSEGNDALGYAEYGKKVEAMRVLLDAGADPNDTGESGITNLMVAVEKPDYPEWGSAEACARLLLARGANPNAIAKDGQTALKIARKAGDRRVVRLLRRAGAWR